MNLPHGHAKNSVEKMAAVENNRPSSPKSDIVACTPLAVRADIGEGAGPPAPPENALPPTALPTDQGRAAPPRAKTPVPQDSPENSSGDAPHLHGRDVPHGLLGDDQPRIARAGHAPVGNAPTWQIQLQGAIRSTSELMRRTAVDDRRRDAQAGSRHFSVLVPHSFVARMASGDHADPLLRQVMATEEEEEMVPGFSSDPVDDAGARLVPGMLQKYAGRALLVVTGQCAVHCRYCFRRDYPYDDSPTSDAAWAPALNALRDDASVQEIILSGGDPLTLSDDRLGRLAEQLAAVPSLRRLRIHTRLPIVIPARVTESFLDWFTNSRLTPILVVHANHAQEINDEVVAALAMLRRAGVLLFNQAVLLAGVNDSADAQVALCERLIEAGVAPYYLHQLDRAAGTAHFETPIEVGRQIMSELQRRLPGYAVPRYVRESPGLPSKEWLYP